MKNADGFRSRLRSLLAIVSAMALMAPSVASANAHQAAQPHEAAMHQASIDGSLTPLTHCMGCDTDCCQLECGCVTLPPGIAGATETGADLLPWSPPEPALSASAAPITDLPPPAPPPRS